MNGELFEGKVTTAPRIDEKEDRAVLELSLDELSYVAGARGWPSKYEFIA